MEKTMNSRRKGSSGTLVKIPSTREIEQALFEEFPAGIAEEWDNVGLLVGSPDAQVSRVLVALDLTPEVIREAIECGVQLIVTHHPIMFKATQRVLDAPGDGALIHALIRNDIAHIAMHTNVDSAQGGLNDYLAEALGLRDIQPLHSPRNMHKIAAFVPRDYVEAVFQAMSEAGAGRLGAYSHCSFLTEGTGTFLPGRSAQPFIGVAGETERTAEVRVESIVEACDVQKVIAAMRAAHPYEQPAYDVLELKHVRSAHGSLRRGVFENPVSLGAFADKVKSVLGADAVQVVGPLDKEIKTAAVCGGSGGSFLPAAAGADVLLTGEAKHDQMLFARQIGTAMIIAGHYYSERLAESLLIERLQAVFHRLQYMSDILITQTIAPYITR